jgi:hypothetical protein
VHSGFLEPLLCGRRGVYRAKLVSENNLLPRNGCEPPFKRSLIETTSRLITLIHAQAVSYLGWVQLVRSTDGASAGKEFETDPFEPLGPTPHPFCFFGFAPRLFDAPAPRRSREDMDWRAESFLCFVPMNRRETRAILGFSWGFTIRAEAISLTPPAPLAPEEWDKHRTLLRREHPAWTFATGYRNH